MASSILFEDLTPDFSCSVCLEWFCEPVSLPCGHLYCRSCIETVWGSPGNEFICPQCRKRFPERRYIPCKLLGNLIHRIQRISPLEIEEGRRSENTCGEPLLCQDRTLHPTQMATGWYKEELSLAVSQLQSKLTKLLKMLKEEEQRLQDHQAVMLSLGDHLSNKFSQLHSFLCVCEETLKGKLEKKGDALLPEVEGRLRKLKESYERGQELLLEAQDYLKRHNSPEFPKGIHSLLNRVKQHQDMAAIPDLPSELQILGQFKGPIQYIAWKEMKSAFDVEFPQITLDPETAHPCLVLLDDCTCVRDGHLRRDVPDTPMRFNYCIAVLGCQGFSSGKHYWEVEVGNKPSWTLGLVSISINRKGKIAASPTNGYWVIRLRNGVELMAKDMPPQRLCPLSFPKRVGIYLDYEGGLVSFYDSSIMDHLYTFATSRFMETLLPYFCPGLYDSGKNSAPLKIHSYPHL